MSHWDKKWNEIIQKNKITSGIDIANDMTIEAAGKIESLSNILKYTLNIDDSVDWDSLKDYSKYPRPPLFEKPEPVPQWLKEPVYRKPNITFFDKLFGSKKRKLATARQEFDAEILKWEAGNDEIQSQYETEYIAWAQEKNEYDQFYKIEEKNYYKN